MTRRSETSIVAAQAPVDFLTLPHWRAIAVVESEHAYEVEAIPLSERSACPQCGAGGAALRPCGTRRQSIRDAPVRGKHVTIHFVRRLYKCRECRRYLAQPLPGIDPRRRATTRLIELIGVETFSKTHSLVSKETGVAPSMARDIFLERVSELERSVRPEAPRVIGLDEVYVRGRARCLLIDLEARQPLEILPKTDVLTLCRRLLELPQRDRVEAVVMDWSRRYLEVTRRVLPQAAVVIDKWAVWQLAQQPVAAVLRKVRADSTSDQGFRLAGAYRLIRKGHSRLSGAERAALTEFFQQRPELGEAYRLRGSFFAIWNFQDRRKAEARYEEWVASIPPGLHYAFGELVRTVGSWHQEVFNYFDLRITNGAAESVARRLNVLQSVSPTSSFETLRAKVLYESFAKRPQPRSEDGNTISFRRKASRLRPRARRALLPLRPDPFARLSDELGERFPPSKREEDDKKRG